MNIEHITLLFLITVFVLAEIYRARRSVRGVVVSFEDTGPLNFFGEVRTVVVKLSSGELIQARMSSCAQCLGKIEPGSEVRIFDSSEGFQIDPVWIRSSKNCAQKNSCAGR